MTLLIPLSYLNEACFLSEKVDEKKYKVSLREAQNGLKAILGAEFYDEISSQYPSSFTTDNDTLYENYIKDYLAWATYLEYLGFSQSDSTGSGLRQFTDENSTILEGVKLYSIEQNVRRKCQYYRNQMVNFLRLSQSQDSTKYTKWIGYLKNPFSFGFSSINRGNKEAAISINRAATRNE